MQKHRKRALKNTKQTGNIDYFLKGYSGYICIVGIIYHNHVFVVWKWTLTDYVNSGIVMVSQSLLGRYSWQVLSLPTVLLQRMLLQALWSCPALAPRSRPQYMAARGPASRHGFGSGLALCYDLCCVAPLTSNLDLAFSLGTLVPPSD